MTFATLFTALGFAGARRPLASGEHFLQGAEQLEQARKTHASSSPRRLDKPFEPAIGGPVDIQDEAHKPQRLSP
ncbi:MAG TPA: hypothetical protein VME46_05455 [Acidimicrobiales bacterium]|nr:hypothetical protein [Acidimicrobiales bacterium]